jgi:hypothetical protein
MGFVMAMFQEINQKFSKVLLMLQIRDLLHLQGTIQEIRPEKAHFFNPMKQRQCLLIYSAEGCFLIAKD